MKTAAVARAPSELTDHPASSHAITRITLENFRNYRSLALDVPPGPVVLAGKNGAGKTNLLEAISWLMPGRGLRGATLKELDYSLPVGSPPFSPPQAGGMNGAWVMTAEILTQGITHQIGMGRAPDSEGGREKRILKIDGEIIRQQSALTRYVSIWWLTPAMDQLFNAGNSARRRFLDRLVYGFDAEHAARISRYERAMRERNALLAEDGRADTDWLSVLEQQIAEESVAITRARNTTLAAIEAAMQSMPTAFPHAQMTLQNSGGETASIIEQLFKSRPKDAASGRTLTGVHRDSLEVIHSLKAAPAEQCSTGEQKALLLAMLLAAARAKAEISAVPPILLLDEVVAHLDVDKRGQLFDLIRATAIQAWMTGTDAADFQGLQGFATLLEIADGRVVR
jgi:DNA replication and repair protein RecF